MMKLNRNINKFTVIFLILLFSLNSCGIYKKTDVKTNPINDADKRAKNLAEGKGIQLLNSKKNSGVFDFASSNEMWRASIEILDFTPLVSADYGGGILISDWYSNQDSSLESYKITVVFLSNEIRADGLNVKVHKKTCNANYSCKIIEQKTKLNTEIKSAILRRASEIKDKKIKDRVDADKSYKKDANTDRIK
ncbi:DUF3576 domain-containing protein [Candidatus Pelagibacter sp.]|nr:DUF3576 domain-containing protein [Candidatus Pelagibacter sp.]